MGCNQHSNLLLRWMKLSLLPILLSFTITITCALTTMEELELEQSKSTMAIYTAIAPKIFSPHSTYTVSISVDPRKDEDGNVLQTKTPLEFQGEIRSLKENYTAKETVSILPGNTGVLSFQIEDLTASQYNLTLKIKDGEKEEIKNITRIFPKTQDERIILIHTDKPAYKPGETVQFRVILLNWEAKPFEANLEENIALQVKIFDPEGNVIKLWDNAQTHSGLFSCKLELSSEPILGDWNIEVKPKPKLIPKEKETEAPKAPDSNDKNASSFQSRKVTPIRIIRPRPVPDDVQTKSRSFTVAQYVLPKFKVDVKLPPFITFSDNKVPVHVQATYTYGKGVKGDCTIVPKKPYYNYGELEKVIENTFPIDGSAVKEIDIQHLFPDKNNIYEQEILFEVQVTESVTGKSQNGTGTVYMYRYPYKISSIDKTEFVKPGLPFSIVFKISTQDNIPIHDPAPNALKIRHGFSYDVENSTLESSIPPNGLVPLTFSTPTNEFNRANQIDVKYKKLNYEYYVNQKYNLDTHSYLNIKWLGENSNDDNDIEFRSMKPTVLINSKLLIYVNSTKPFSSVNYLIHGGRGEILEFKKVILESPVDSYTLEITCPATAPPEAKIIVFILNAQNEIIVDSLIFTAKTISQDEDSNFLNITVSESESKPKATFEPGQNINLKLDSKPNSLVALRGVDQSVLLLEQKDVDITQSAVEDEIKSKNDEAMNMHRLWGGSYGFQIFDTRGLIILTNAILPSEIAVWREEESEEQSDGFNARPALAFAAAEASVVRLKSGPGGGGDNIRVRSKFPETWLWEEVTLNESNSFDLQKTVPDTLTSWIITGYSLNTNYGLGVLPQPKKITTFRPFFISLNLPYSVVKGEILVLQVLVHNYLPSEDNPSHSAEITLDNSKGQFQFNDKSLADAKSHTKTVTCPPNAVTSVNFVIVPTEFGSIMLDVKGLIQNPGMLAGDALSQPLKVIPPGQQQRRTASAFISTGKAANLNNNSMEASLTTIYPETRVQGADNVKISFISDILGSTIANLDRMIQMPTGCGEQNLLSFVADIVILNYLKATLNLNEKVKAKATKYLESGYQRELTYRHWDGSFSSFGTSDNAGSTWLTAFVVRSFIEAKPHITIDDRVIERALEFLSNKQSNDGALFENGKVFSSYLQGGSGTSGVALTAYTIVAFIEAAKYKEQIAKEKQEELSNQVEGQGEDQDQDGNLNLPSQSTEETKPYSSNIERGLNFITNQTKTVNKDDPYALVLTTYALHLANHSQKDEYFDKMQELATHKGGLTFWEDKKDKSKLLTKTTYRPWHLVTQPVSVEMTGYALLTYILRGKVAESFPLVKWLLKERNAYGGFLSTQDTVVGLTALAKYAELTKEKTTNLQVKASYNSGDREITIDENNAEVLQEFELPHDTNSVQLAASGTGTGTVLAQLMWSYYVEDGVPEPAFTIDVKTLIKSKDETELKICTSYLRGEESNMAIIEVNLPSGYSVDTVETLANLKDVPGYKRYDTENRDTKLMIYMDSITLSRTCIRVTALRTFKVGKPVPVAINVYDYYDTTKCARVFYEVPVQARSICEICLEGNDCTSRDCAH